MERIIPYIMENVPNHQPNNQSLYDGVNLYLIIMIGINNKW